MNILLVEDDIDVSTMYGVQLEREEYGVRYARSAQEALDVLEEDKFDILILDILLPGSNGIAVLQELQGYEDWRTIPVIVLSNVTKDDLAVDARHLQDLGVQEYLIKMQTTPDDLATAVRAVA